MADGPDFAHRYAARIARWRWWIVAASIAFVVVGALTAAQLRVFADFSYLLPQDARSVKDLRAISARARVIGTAVVIVESTDAVARRQAAVMLRDQITAFDPGLVSSVTFDHSVERKYGWDHRWLFVDLADLVSARDALADEIRRAKLDANPLYIGLDDPPATAAPSAADKLRTRLHDEEIKKDDPGELVGSLDAVPKPGTLQMMVVHTAFSSGDVDKDKALLAALRAAIARTKAAVPGIDAGIAGDIAVSVAEQDSILNSMLLATLVTVVLVIAALLWFFRSMLALGALSWSLMVGTVATFAFTKLAIGHLNLATAFLSSIVIGNGINVGILVTSRYLEEIRAGKDDVEALAGALSHTIAGTLAAALTAAVAYSSLIITVFRGFRHFGIIGGVGILLCWIAAYTVLPAALSIGYRLGMRPRTEAPLGRWLARLLPNNLTMVAGVTIALTIGAAIVTTRYLTNDPFEANFKNLRSKSAQITDEIAWMHDVNMVFGEGIDAGFAVALPTRARVEPLVAELTAVDRGKAPADKLFGDIKSIDDLLPKDQAAKLEVLAQIRALLSGKDLDALSDADRTEALRLRPPDDLHALGDDDIPTEIAWPFIEADGSRGKIVLATQGPSYEVWNAHDVVRFSERVRAIGLPDDVKFGGSSFVFADVLESVLRDGPRATLASIAGAILIVLLVVGRGRHGMITIVCGLSGTILMLAAGALLGLRVNFLDFVALPITIGIGIEYAVNIVTRERQEGPGRGRAALATTGGAVFLCSYTTIVGYGSLLLSSNLGIRSFGTAAMLGEVCCLGVALVLAPALLWTTAPRLAREAAAASHP